LASDPSSSDVFDLLRQRKKVALGTSWVTTRNGSLEFRAALTDGQIALEGVSLFMNCLKVRPDEQVTVGLTIEGARKPYCCARVDWREITSHPNANALCGDLQFVDAGRTHFHNPELIPNDERFIEHLKANLPIAVAINTPIRSFSDLVDCCKRLLNIENLEEIPSPPWQQQAF
jgi:hypothetical protein